MYRKIRNCLVSAFKLVLHYSIEQWPKYSYTIFFSSSVAMINQMKLKIKLNFHEDQERHRYNPLLCATVLYSQWQVTLPWMRFYPVAIMANFQWFWVGWSVVDCTYSEIQFKYDAWSTNMSSAELNDVAHLLGFTGPPRPSRPIPELITFQ